MDVFEPAEHGIHENRVFVEPRADRPSQLEEVPKRTLESLDWVTNERENRFFRLRNDMDGEFFDLEELETGVSDRLRPVLPQNTDNLVTDIEEDHARRFTTRAGAVDDARFTRMS